MEVEEVGRELGLGLGRDADDRAPVDAAAAAGAVEIASPFSILVFEALVMVLLLLLLLLSVTAAGGETPRSSSSSSSSSSSYHRFSS